MKKTLAWPSEVIVNIYDEASLWSAPFGKISLENPLRFADAETGFSIYYMPFSSDWEIK